MGTTDEEHNEEEGYRLLLPKRSHPFDQFVTSRCTLELTPRQVQATEQIGPFKKRYQHVWDANSEINLEAMEGTQRASGKQTYGIRIKTAGREAWLAIGYPHEKLQEVLGQLERAHQEWRDRLGRPASWGAGAGHAQTLDQPSVPDDSPSRGVQPGTQDGQSLRPLTPAPTRDGSAEIQMRSTPDGVHISVPAAGLRRGTQGLWAPYLFVLVIFGGILISTLLGQSLKNFSGLLPAIPIVLIFGGVFGGLGLGLLNMAKRMAVLEVTSTSLRIRRKTLFGDRTYDFPKADITDVRKGNSDMQINGKAVEELQVMVNGHMKVRMLTQRKPEEIQAVAEAIMANLSQPGDLGNE